MSLTQKETVLKLRPQAICLIELGRKQSKSFIIEIDGKIYGSHARQSWAWAEAHRKLLKEIYQ